MWKLSRGKQEGLFILTLVARNFLTGSQTSGKLRRAKALAAGEILGREKLIHPIEEKLRAPDHLSLSSQGLWRSTPPPPPRPRARPPLLSGLQAGCNFFGLFNIFIC
jgi:hypothetical protein